MTRRYSILAAAILGCAGAAIAQPADDAAISAFVQVHTVGTHIGRAARWDDAICPAVEGLPDNFKKFVVQRIKTVALAAGAKVDADGCKANVNVVFTSNPQALLNSIRAGNPAMIGYYESSAQADKLATVTHPIQAWYVTKTVDLRGKFTVDTRYGRATQNYDSQASAGTRMSDGLVSAFYSIMIVADPSKLGDHEIGALADNIAVLALSQPATLDTCTALPSIVNLSLAGCTAATALTGMSASDGAFLYGVYHMRPGTSRGAQRDAIGFSMKDKLAGK